MNREALKYAGVGLVVVIGLVAGVLYWTRGAHIELRGSVQQVRVQAMDERSSVVVIDFRFVNPSDYPFVVRTAKVFLELSDGARLEGMPVSDVSAKRLFEYYPLLGQKYNRSLLMRDRVESRETMDRMICARFEVPDSTVELRKRLIVRIEDVDGAVSEIVEEPEKKL